MKGNVWPKSFPRRGEFWTTLIFGVILVIFVPLEVECSMFRRSKTVPSSGVVIQSTLSFKKSGNESRNGTLAEMTLSAKPRENSTVATLSKPTLTTEATARSSSTVFIPGLSSSLGSTLRTSTTAPTYKTTPIGSSHTSEFFEEDTSPFATSERTTLSTSTLEKIESKSAIPSLLFITSLGTMATSTMKSVQYHHSSSSTILTKKKPTTKRPVRISTSKKPKGPTSHPNKAASSSHYKRRPKPGRTTSTTTTTPYPFEYDYGSEDAETSSSVTTTKTTTASPKVTLSKLAVAMLSSSSSFKNSTKGPAGPLYYPATPINLLNILQAYTKQMQLAAGGNSTSSGNGEFSSDPIVRIPNTGIRLNMNQISFAAKLGISLYYSVIAIIPLIYIAFGGVGRGILDAITGRSLSKKRRRKRSVYYNLQNNRHLSSHPTKRAALTIHDENDDYAWILARISQIILEVSLSDSEDELM